MIGLGLAASHAPAIFAPAEIWPKIYASIPDYTKESQPHTARAETPEVIDDYIGRADRAYEFLKRQLEAYRPDALVIIGNDQGEMFDMGNCPSLAVFTGDAFWGVGLPRYIENSDEISRFSAPGYPALASRLLEGLVALGFNPTNCREFRPAGERRGRGMSHAFTLPLPRLTPNFDVPVIPVFINCHYHPMPDGEQCWRIGAAIRSILDPCSERIAVFASGGMSHDPDGPRAGWIDEPLDRWVLNRIASARGEDLRHLFSFDSDTLRGGTGELRSWIAAAAACPWPGKTVEYFPCHHAKTGIGFCCWPAELSQSSGE